nr:reverse transcriptase-like protein [Serratia marcescens]
MEKHIAIANEVEKLLNAGFIREVEYPEWLANVVMVKKANGKWRMCIDFTDLNKACPKDCYPLPNIDLMVDSTAGHALLSFVDAYSGYHQIKMNPADEEKTSFIVAQGTYCYKVMPFGLKNAGATFQRLVDQVFAPIRGRVVEAYVDDLVIKSKDVLGHPQAMKETFEILRQHKMRLNPEKCAFGVASGKFLGFLVSERGIEANPAKIKAVIDMKPPKSRKDIQSLNGKIAALGRFVARSGDKCQPFFKKLKKSKQYEWDEECDQAFEQIKKYLSSPPILGRPIANEVLYLYIAISQTAFASVLVREQDKIQQPVYYISHTFLDAETRYTDLEKLALAVVKSSRRLRPYFDAHPIRVLTNYPLKVIMTKLEKSGRIVKWAQELGRFDIDYLPRPAIKAQALADFVVECTSRAPEYSDFQWRLYVDGSATTANSGAGILLLGPDDAKIEYALSFAFQATNNEAEYEALLAGLRLTREMGAGRLQIFSDSQLVVNQIGGTFSAEKTSLIRYRDMAKSLLAKFKEYTIEHLPRGENTMADALARLASAVRLDDAKPRTITVEVLKLPSVDGSTEVLPIQIGNNWMTNIIKCLEGVLPQDAQEAKKIRAKSARYVLQDGVLYRRSASMPLLRCLSPEEAEEALKMIHDGACDNHPGARTLAHKALRAGFFWPTMKHDAQELVRRCDACQRFSNVPRAPATEVSIMQSPCPFAQWGMDLLGPFPQATGQRKFLIVAIDYFTKWVEAEALAKITEDKIEKFFYRQVICRFGLPCTLITDNGKQFDNTKFSNFCRTWGIDHRFTSVAHPQTNGLAEVTNRTILQGLKKKLEAAKGRWAEVLDDVLWAYRTTPREATGESPYFLTFGVEALVPVEVLLASHRVVNYNEATNDQAQRMELDLLEEEREEAKLRSLSYRLRAARYHNRRVRPRAFQQGDLVLRNVEATGKHLGKLDPAWEGPFVIQDVLPRGAYHLINSDGTEVPRSWNAEHLKKYYP